MVKMTTRWYRSRRNVVMLCVVVALSVMHYISLESGLDQDDTLRYIENTLEEALKLDKGSGCEIPQLDPFSTEVSKFDKKLPPVECHGQDWVKCYHSKCRVVDAVQSTVSDIVCEYRDILYHSDVRYTLGPATTARGGAYALRESDHVTVTCGGTRGGSKVKWSGTTLGFRPVPLPPAPPGHQDSYDVVIFGFDSTARNGFIRRMPKSWKVLKEIGATVMEGGILVDIILSTKITQGIVQDIAFNKITWVISEDIFVQYDPLVIRYNIVGDGTPAALFPILTGKTELELPDVRRSLYNRAVLDSFPFIFNKLKQDGYRTAYFEDLPQIGTFQYRFNGFRRQPADHYLRAFYQETESPQSGWRGKNDMYCVGDTPQFKLMINITQQFLELDGKKFIFTFIADITHNDFNMIESADDDTAAFLRGLLARGDDTLVVVMGDHGPRYANVRDTLQGKLEERLPLLALRLPARLVRARPTALRALRQNARALSTPHDLHATLLDVLDMRQRWNPYKVRGADLKRGLTMLEPIPRNRSCSEAGIEPHWCACLAWQPVSADDPFYTRTADALMHYINSLFEPVRSLCAPRTLTSTEWVLRQRPNSRLLAFANAKDKDGYVGRFDAKTTITHENYQIKIVVGPGRGVYEASLSYLLQEDRFLLSTRDISRTNAYKEEPACVSATHPHLNPYCYCR